MKQIDPKKIAANAIELIGDRWMLVTAGEEGHFNTMTASWGGLGELWYKPVAFVFIRPQRYTYEFAEQSERMTLSFFGEEYRKALQICGSRSGRDGDKIAAAGLTPQPMESGGVAFREATLVLECRKLYAEFLHEASFVDPATVQRSYPQHDFHKMYIMEIEKAWVRE